MTTKKEIKQKSDYFFRNISTNLGVKYISISSCFLKSFSLVQIPQPKCNANAKYGTSFLCGANFSALDCTSSGNLYIGNITTLLLRIPNSSITSDSETPQILAITPRFLLNSSIKYGKATNLNLSSKNNSFVLLLPIIAANKTVASTTNSIYLPRNLFATASEILSVNSLAVLSEILILDEIPLSRFNFSALSINALLAISDQSNLNSFIDSSNSSGIDIVKVPILTSPDENNKEVYLNLSDELIANNTAPEGSNFINTYSLGLTFPTNGIINLMDPATGGNVSFKHGHTSAFAPNADKGNISAFIWVDVPTSQLSAQLYNATWNVTAINNP